MKDFLGSVEYNKNGDLLISSSCLTFQDWSGSYAVIDKKELTKVDSSNLLSNCESYIKVKSGVCTARWLSNDSFLTGTDCGKLELVKWNKNFDSLMSKEEHDGLVTCIDRKFDSETAVSGSSDCRIKIWDLNEALSVRTFRGHDFSVTSVSLNPLDTNCLISTAEDGKAVFWDMRKPKPGFNLKHGLNSYPTCSTWSAHDSNSILLGFVNGHVGVFDLRNMSLGIVHRVHERQIRQVKSNKLKLISTASDDCTSKVFQVRSTDEKDLKLIYSFKHDDYVTDLDWNPDDELDYVTCSWDGTLKNHKINLKTSNGI